MSAELKWLKRKDGSLVAKHAVKKGMDVFVITSIPLSLGRPAKNYNPTLNITKDASGEVIKTERVQPTATGQRYTLYRNNVRIYELDISLHFQPMFSPPLTEKEVRDNKERKRQAKDCIKQVAERLVEKTGPIYQKVLASLKNKDKYNTKEQFIFTIKEVYKLDRLPEIEGPAKPFFFRCAEEGMLPRMIPLDRLKKVGLDREDLTETYLDSLFVEVFPTWRKKMVKDSRLAATTIAVEKTAVKSPEKKEKIVTHETTEVYKGRAPEERSKEGLKVVRQVILKEPRPHLAPENAKFSTLLRWAEKVRDWFQVRGYFASVEFLVNYVQYFFDPSWERCQKAARRIKAIYAQEWKQHQANIQAMIQIANTKPKEEVKKPKVVTPKVKKGKVERDKWNAKIGSRMAAINWVFLRKPKTRPKMSVVKITKLAKVKGDVRSHLTNLVKQGRIIRLKSGKYRLKSL